MSFSMLTDSVDSHSGSTSAIGTITSCERQKIQTRSQLANPGTCSSSQRIPGGTSSW